MIASIAKRLLGWTSARELRRFSREVEAVGSHEESMRAMPDDAFPALTQALRERAAAGEALGALLPEAFAAAREAARRVLGQRPYDVQLIGAVALHHGRIAEMRTGEGKTLVAVLPAYLNSLTGRGVHVVTVNDYLARRDSAEMGRVLQFLGCSVGCVVPGMIDDWRRAAYAADVTYATNAEVGFDHLRDNMKQTRGEMVQRPFSYAIVDEVDSILVDEARTPLIISGQGPDCSVAASIACEAVAALSDSDWDADIKHRSVALTERGLLAIEGVLRGMGVIEGDGAHLHDEDHLDMVPFVHQALRARVLFQRDKDYVVQDGKVAIVDANTGRVMDGRRWSDGLHQAIEAREGVEILPDNVTMASITYQNLFRMYPKLSGMTGTAATEEEEFRDIYGLEVVQVPTNLPVARVDSDDELFLTEADRDGAVADLVAAASARGQPVLVGTSSIERSEALSAVFAARGVRHAVLNARHHEQEARIVAQAGRPGAVTISTNMAGRGTDIRLGGNVDALLDEVVAPDADPGMRQEVRAQLAAQVEEDARAVRAAGGLLVVGTERHESRRVDDQLRGRSGRQGDPGASRFMVSLEDELMRRFMGPRVAAMLPKLGVEPGEAIAHPWLTRSVRKAQERVEAQNFEARKGVLRYDTLVNVQRKVFYSHRMSILDGEVATGTLEAMREDAVSQLAAAAMPAHSFPEQWDVEGLRGRVAEIFDVHVPVAAWAAEEGVEPEAIRDRLMAAIEARRSDLLAGVPPEAVAEMERRVLIQSLDGAWQDYLSSLDLLRDGIGLRAYAQRDPVHEWNQVASSMFERMFDAAAHRAITVLSRMTIVPQDAAPADEPMTFDHGFWPQVPAAA